LLLDGLRHPAAYLPVDISPEYLFEQVRSLRGDFPGVHIQPVFADFTQSFALPVRPAAPGLNLVFFPGSTIGNLSRHEALRLLEAVAVAAQPAGALLIGVDLPKHPAILHAAYNDVAGVTAEFNLNLLARLNRELDAEFDPRRFEHQAVYDGERQRIEMRLVSTTRQRVSVAGVEIEFAPLRVCRTCGHVGCCDDSKNRHATKHFRATQHPIMTSIEPGESWSWCSVDRIVLD
jgi:L-histidine N-alpha-methyltransferase